MLLAIGGIVTIVALVAIVTIYNAFVRLRVLTENAWSDIEVQLKRRHDLIPNLVESVKGYTAHEAGTLEAVVNARNRAAGARSPDQAGRLEGELSRTLASLFALAENYPQLRASENFAQLQSALSEIEEVIQNARRYYNAVARDLNTKLDQFPSNLVGSTFGFAKAEFFELQSGEEAVPQVDFKKREV